MSTPGIINSEHITIPGIKNSVHMGIKNLVNNKYTYIRLGPRIVINNLKHKSRYIRDI